MKTDYDKINTENELDAFVARRKKELTIAEGVVNAYTAKQATGKLTAQEQIELKKAQVDVAEFGGDLAEEAPQRKIILTRQKKTEDDAQAAKDKADAEGRTTKYRETYESEFEAKSRAQNRQGPGGSAQVQVDNSDDYQRQVRQYLPKEYGGTGEKQPTGTAKRVFETINPYFLSSIFGRGNDEIRAELQAEDIVRRGGGRMKRPMLGGFDPLQVLTALQSGDPQKIRTITEALGVTMPDFETEANPPAGATATPPRQRAQADIDVATGQGAIAQGEVGAETAYNPDIGKNRLGARGFIPTITTLGTLATGLGVAMDSSKKAAAAEAPRDFLPEDREFFRSKVEPIRADTMKEAKKGKIKEREKANQLLADAFKTITGATYDSYGSLSPRFIQEQFMKQKTNIWHEGFSKQDEIMNLAVAAHQKRARGENPAEELSALRAAYNRASVKNKGPVYIGGMPEDLGDMSHTGASQLGIFTMIPGADGNPTLVVIPRHERGYNSPIDVGAAPDEPDKDMSSLGADFTDTDYLTLPGARDALTKAIATRDAEARARGEPARGTYRPR